jgi:hypothetical protein
MSVAVLPEEPLDFGQRPFEADARAALLKLTGRPSPLRRMNERLGQKRGNFLANIRNFKLY